MPVALDMPFQRIERSDNSIFGPAFQYFPVHRHRPKEAVWRVSATRACNSRGHFEGWRWRCTGGACLPQSKNWTSITLTFSPNACSYILEQGINRKHKWHTAAETHYSNVAQQHLRPCISACLCNLASSEQIWLHRLSAFLLWVISWRMPAIESSYKDWLTR